MRQIETEYTAEIRVFGIHSPKFPAERETGGLRAAVERLGIMHPVANDREYRIWQAYAVQAWPTLVFVDPAGRIIGRHEGEFDTGAMKQTLDAMIASFQGRGILERRVMSEPPRPPDATDHLRFPGKAIGMPDGGYAVSDTGHHRVVLLDGDGRATHVFGGTNPGFQDGGAEEARFSDPQGLCLFQGGLLVADTGNHALRLIDVAAGQVRTLTGTGHQGSVWNSPWDLAAANDGVLIAMAGNHTLAEWSPEVPEGRLFLGSGREGLRDGSGSWADFAQPSGICIDGNLAYIADSETSAIRAVEIQRHRVRTLLGKGLFEFGDRDGPASEARLQHPLGVVASGDNVYIADAYNHRIKRLDLKAGQVSTLAGAGRPGLLDAPGPDGLFSEPGGIALAHGRLLVADTNNHALRWVDPATAEVGTIEVTGLW